MLMAVGMFLLSAVVILIAGTKLSHYGDRIAEHSGLGRLWIGVVLMAAATSLPEVFTAVSAVLIDAPNMAVGDLFGAGLSNMLTLALIDVAYRQKRVWQQAALEQALIASLAVTLTGLAGLLIVVRQPLPFWNVGLGTFAIALIYVLGMRVVLRQEDMRRREQQLARVVEAEEAGSNRPVVAGALKRAVTGFALASVGILVAAPLLAESAKEIAEATGVSTTFIGTSLVAITTSLPELVTTFAAVRLGAFDLAVGNLFGSNAFNMAVLFLADIAYRKGPLLAAVEATHVVTAFVSMLLMSVGLMGIIYRAEKRFVLIEPDSVLMIVGYLLGMWLLFRIGG
ncbi:MAG: sodium:calcium antiporter [Nitrospira sp.]|nr:MAG: sodium:calcium antiporter [Nitrospira sp.]